MRYGFPRRLYRGKILKLLHHHTLTNDAIAGILWDRFTSHDLEWLSAVLKQMEDDGLIGRNKRGYRITQ